MQAKNLLKVPLRGFLGLRSLHYFLQFQTLSRLTSALPFLEHRARPLRREDFEILFRELRILAHRDVDNIAEGIYPAKVLKTESLTEHSMRIPRLFLDGIQLNWRRQTKNAKHFSSEALTEAKSMPSYYRRNYHYQTDGYLSERSAELYEHQVELLFSGMADAMRRLFLKDLKGEIARVFGSSLGDNKSTPLRILEVACGTGRSSRFVSLALPRAKITATDLSEPYLRVARKKLADLSNVELLQGDATQLAFDCETFDVAYNVFLFHELPSTEIERVLRESFRVLRPGGFFAAVDSLQLGDRPEFDSHLKRFPVDYHEPFYMNYIKNPLEEVLANVGFELRHQGTGFLSKYWVAQKPIEKSFL